MSVFQTIQGTSEVEFRIGLTGSTIYQGSADPTVSPPTPLGDGLRDGDIYIRTQTGGAGIWINDNGGTWTQVASGASGGSFAGDVQMQPGAQFLGDESASAAVPSYAFDNDDDTGMFRSAADEIGFATAGVQRFVIEDDGTLSSTTSGYEALVLADNDIPNLKYVDDNYINTAGDTFTGDVTMDTGTQLFFGNGTVGDPAFSFTNDPDNGLFLDAGFGSDAMTISSGGTSTVTFDPTGMTMRPGAQVFADVGLVGEPSYSFAGDTDTGFYQPVTGSTAFSSDGTEVIRFTGTAANGTLLWQGGDGTVGGPGHSFASDTTSGTYLAGAGDVGISAAGADALRLNSSSVIVSPSHVLEIQDGGTSNPGLQFDGDITAGIYRPGAGILGLVAGGAEAGRITSTGFKAIDGDVSNPSFSFTAEPTSGWYRAAAGNVALTVLGTQEMLITNSAANFNENVRVNEFNQGSSFPGFSFTGDNDTGMYNGGANELGFSTGGTARWQIETNGDFEPQTNNTYDIGSSSLRVATVYATTFDGTATAAQYSDLAERYTVGDGCILEPGDVVVICDHDDYDICLCGDTEGDTAVLGVVSTAPAFMMNKDAGDDDTAPYIALRGRVPVKVCGNVKKGDLLITCGDCNCHAGCAGHARALEDWEKKSPEFTHSVFAKALASHDGQLGNGVVEAVIL